MNVHLEKIFTTGIAIDAKGEEVKLDSAIDRAEADFITRQITDNKLNAAIEVGCAMGLSSLAIADALHRNTAGNYKHYIIDPFQTTEWRSIGVTGLNRAGFDRYTLIEKRSEYALPLLCEEGVTVDFGFIDGWHTFDHTLIDFFYINRMLSVGGVVVIDDVHMPAINKCVRYLYNYPAYEYCGHVPSDQITFNRKMLDAVRSVNALSKHVIGKRISTELLSAETLRSDSSLHLHCNMIAFRKIREDQRPWNWYEPF